MTWLTRATTDLMMQDMNTRYLVRSNVNPKMVYCTDGEFHHETQTGPGGFCAKLYKTERGARGVRNGDVTVSQCDERGVENGIRRLASEVE